MTKGMTPVADPTHREDWATPWWVVETTAEMLAIEGFALDACALEATRKAPDYYGPDHIDPAKRDALAVDWPATAVWCNPPFGAKAARAFVRQAQNCASRGGLVALLLPNSKTEQLWHIELMLDHRTIGLIHVAGRLAFAVDGKPVKGNPAGSEIIIIGRNPMRRPMAYGAMMRDAGGVTWRWR
jgi:predicted RNA methylase